MSTRSGEPAFSSLIKFQVSTGSLAPYAGETKAKEACHSSMHLVAVMDKGTRILALAKRIRSDGNVSARAKALGIARPTLIKRLSQCGIDFEVGRLGV